MSCDIAFDIDETMGRFMAPVEEILKSRGYKFNDIGMYDIQKSVTPHLSKKEMYEIFEIVYASPKSVPIIDRAPELCTRLFEKTGDPVMFITSRPFQWASETHRLVRRFCRVPYILIFADPQYGKLPYMNGTNFFVDDRRKTALKLAEAGKTVFVPIRTWNDGIKNNPNIVYIEDVGDLISYINIFVK